MSNATKQTAANNQFLANVKRVFNGKVYTKTLQLVNNSGEQAAREYLGTIVKNVDVALTWE